MEAKKEEQGEEEEGEEILLNEPPKTNKTRRKRNIPVGWLCCRIVKAFVKKNVLL